MAKPLMDRVQSKIDEEDITPLHVDITNPVVLSVPPPPTSVRTAESLI